MDQRAKAILRRSLRPNISTLLLAALCLLPLAARAQSVAAGALPSNPRVAAGQAGIAVAGARMDVTQTTQKAVINWDSFNIGKGAQVNFNQPNAAAITLNRVTTGTTSVIDGQLTANGQVFLVNPAGVYFGNGASVSVGGLVASTMSIADKDFLDGNYRFTRDGATSAIINQGRLEAVGGGYVALLAPEVRNEGVIVANRGTIGIGAGEAVVLDFQGDQLTGMQVDPTAIKTLIESKRAIEAEGGLVMLTSQALEDVTAGVINLSGHVKAKTIAVSAGKGDALLTSATLDANNSAPGGTGGTVKVLGNRVGLFAETLIDATGDVGGGVVLVGGNWQGKGPEQNASATYVGKNARIKADAVDQGDGGKVVVWADDTTRFYGDISVRGGAQAGDGGHVEVSGKNALVFQGTVDASAPHGTAGTLLLDPANIDINAAAPDLNGDGSLLDLTSSSIAFATNPGANSVITAGAVVTQLNTANVALQATNNITVNSPIDTTPNTGSFQLVLRAGNDINLNADLILPQSALFHGIVANSAGGPASGTGKIVLGADVNITVNSAALGISFDGDVVGAHALTVNTGAGTIEFLNNIGQGTALTNLRLTGGTLSFMGSSPVVTTGNQTYDLSSGNLNLPAVTAGGNLTAIATGNITQSGPLLVTGSSVFNASNGTITLTHASNDFGGSVALLNGGANDATIHDANALNLGRVEVGGRVTATAGTIAPATPGIAISIGSGASISSNAAGDAVVLAGTKFINNSGAGAAPYTLSPAQMAQLTKAEISALTPTQLAILTPAQIAAISISGLPGLRPRDIPVLTLAQVSSLTLAQITSLSTSQVAAFTPTQIPAFTAAQISSLTVAQISSLTDSQVAAFTVAQVAAMNPAQVAAMAGGHPPDPGPTAATPTLSAPNGRWLVWSADPAQDTRGGLAYDFKQYNASYGVSAIQGTGNGFLYTLAPTITVGLTGPVSKTYDGSATATLALSNYTTSATTDGDSVSISYPASGTYDDKNAATGKTVTATGIAITGANNGAATVYGYQLASGTASAAVGDITKAPLTVTADNQTRLYGDPDPALTGVITGFKNGETSAVLATQPTYSTKALATDNVGKYLITASGGTATNYSVNSYVDGTLAVTPRPITLTAGSNAAGSRLYGDASNPAVGVAVTGGSLAPHHAALTDAFPTADAGSTANANTNAGIYPPGSTDAYKVIGASNANYAITTQDGTLTVGKPTITITFADQAKQKGAPDPPLGYTITGSLANGDTLSGSPRRDNGETPGQYAIHAGSLSAGSNYNVVVVEGKLTITDPPPPCKENCNPQPIYVGDAYSPKPTLYFAAATALRVDPTAADLPPCLDEEQAAQGDCIATRKSRRLARSTDIANKHAILIGINDYRSPDVPSLDTPVGDVEAVGGLLQSRFGYQPHILKNPTKRDLVAFLNKAIEWVGPNDSLMLFYAGHGVQFENDGMGYWLPADAAGSSPDNWLSNADISRYLSAFAAKQIALVSDSCFSGSLTQKIQVADIGAADRARILSRRAVIVMTSGDQEPVSDGGQDGHSIFAWSLLRHLGETQETTPTTLLFPKIRADVTKDFPQTPQLGAALGADHEQGTDYLLEPSTRQVAAAPLTPAPTTEGAAERKRQVEAIQPPAPVAVAETPPTATPTAKAILDDERLLLLNSAWYSLREAVRTASVQLLRQVVKNAPACRDTSLAIRAERLMSKRVKAPGGGTGENEIGDWVIAFGPEIKTEHLGGAGKPFLLSGKHANRVSFGNLDLIEGRDGYWSIDLGC